MDQISSKIRLTALSSSSVFLLFYIIILTPLPNLGTDILTPSLPAIAIYFKANIALVKFLITIYLITYGIGQLIFGTLSDHIGRRTLLLTGLLSLSLLSIVAIFCHKIATLLVIRFFQGLSVSIISVISKTILTDLYSGEKLNTASKYKVTAQILSIIFAPLLGGCIQLILSWQWTFIILALYSSICFAIIYIYLPETCTTKNQFNYKNTLLNIKMICSHTFFILTTINTAILYTIVGLFGIMGSFLTQITFHYNSCVFGLLACLCGSFYLLGSMLSFKLSSKIISRIITYLFITSPVALIYFGKGGTASFFYIMIPILLIVFGCGLLLPRLMSYNLKLFKSQAGTASAIFGALVMLIMGILLTMMGSINSNSLIIFGVLYLVLGICSTLILHYKTTYKLL